jgi:hypothetical protein
MLLAESMLALAVPAFGAGVARLLGNLIRLLDFGWLWAVCNCFRRLLVCKLLTEKPK